MNRVFIKNTEGTRAFISREELHHLVSVLRTRPGDVFEGITGGDFRYQCRLIEERDSYYGEIIGETGFNDESPLRIELAAALIKRENFELVIQKATELGVVSIIPLVTSRTEIRLDSRREGKKLERWNKIISESVKQCGRNRVPSLGHAIDLEEYLDPTQDKVFLVLDEGGSEPIRTAVNRFRGLTEIAVVIGPEGGWGEVDRLHMKRCPKLVRAGIGPRVLRAETAAVTALSIVQYELGDL
ncbi:MAG: RsmE family RNA methyltransferase [Acidobacteriota bacterium]